MHVQMKRHLGEYKAGKTYDVPDHEGRRWVELGHAITIGPPAEKTPKKAKPAEEPEDKPAPRRRRPFGRTADAEE